MFKALFQFSGGLVLFLWGLQKIKKDFQQIVSFKVQEALSNLTLNFMFAIITGLIITILIQSSSAAIIIIISLVNLKLLNFRQAVGIVVGANIGTTVTVQLISFNLSNYLEFMFISALFFYLIYYFTKINFSKYLGQGLISFSVLLGGLELLSSSLSGLENSLEFVTLLHYLFLWPGLGLLVGLVITAIVQSSSAVTGLVVALAKQKLIVLEAALAVALGSNVGTCITAFLASVGSTREAKLTAWAHLYFNIIGVVVFAPLLPLLNYLLQQFSFDLPRQIANAHTIFNFLTAIIIFLGRDKFITIIHKIHYQARKEV